MLHHRVRARAVKAVMHSVPLPAQTNASCRISGHPGSGAVFRPSCETRRAHVYRQAHRPDEDRISPPSEGGTP